MGMILQRKMDGMKITAGVANRKRERPRAPAEGLAFERTVTIYLQDEKGRQMLTGREM